MPQPTTLALLLSTKDTLESLLHYYLDEAEVSSLAPDLTAVHAMRQIAKLRSTSAANSAILALKGLVDYIDPNYAVPLPGALAELEPDDVCGSYCALAAEMLDAAISFERENIDDSRR